MHQGIIYDVNVCKEILNAVRIVCGLISKCNSYFYSLICSQLYLVFCRLPQLHNFKIPYFTTSNTFIRSWHALFVVNYNTYLKFSKHKKNLMPKNKGDYSLIKYLFASVCVIQEGIAIKHMLGVMWRLLGGYEEEIAIACCRNLFCESWDIWQTYWWEGTLQDHHTLTMMVVPKSACYTLLLQNCQRGQKTQQQFGANTTKKLYKTSSKMWSACYDGGS